MKSVNSWKFRLFIALGLIVSMSLIFQPDIREGIRSKVNPQTREVLAVLNGQFEDDRYQIIKVKTREGLSVEIYKAGAQASIMNLLDRLILPRHKDAHFSFRGETTNLAIDDVDGDRKLEILIPSFDQGLVAQLNVIAFNPHTTRFETKTPEVNQP